MTARDRRYYIPVPDGLDVQPGDELTFRVRKNEDLPAKVSDSFSEESNGLAYATPYPCRRSLLSDEERPILWAGYLFGSFITCLLFTLIGLFQ